MPNPGYGPPKNPNQDALQRTLGAPTSNTMPVDPRPLNAFTQHGAAGTAAGQDMSWMNQPGATTYAGPKADPYTGFQAKHDYSAFDTAREQNPGKSAKDAFAMLSNQAPPPPMQDKTALGKWFAQYIQPGMDQLGHKVSSVDGDKFNYGNHEGNFTVDMAQNAGAPAGSMQQRLQWGADPSDDATRARYGGNGAVAAPPPTGSAAPVLPGQTSDLMEQILMALQQGQEPDPQALLMQSLI